MKRLYGSITRIAVSCLLHVSFIILYLQRRMHGTSLTIGLSRSCGTLRVSVDVQAPCASAIIDCSNIGAFRPEVSRRPHRKVGEPDSPDVCSNVLAISSARRG